MSEVPLTAYRRAAAAQTIPYGVGWRLLFSLWRRCPSDPPSSPTCLDAKDAAKRHRPVSFVDAGAALVLPREVFHDLLERLHVLH